MTMMEKAARVCVARFDASKWEDLSAREREQATDIVRTVLTAIREPDEAMINASVVQGANQVWADMIDAILGEKP